MRGAAESGSKVKECPDCGSQLRIVPASYARTLYQCPSCGGLFTTYGIGEMEPTGKCQAPGCGCPTEEKANYCKACWVMYETLFGKPYWRRVQEDYLRDQRRKKEI